MKTDAAAKLATAIAAITEQKRFILVNPSPDEMAPIWDGLTIYIPGRDDTRVSPDGKKVWESYRDPVTKKMIPGTLVVWDIYEETALGQKKVWDVTSALRMVLGVKETKKGFVYEGVYGGAGLGVALDGASREDIEAVRENGMERWRQEERAVAMMRVRAHDERNLARKRDQMAPIEDTEDIRQARQIMDLLGASERNTLLRRYDIAPTGAAKAAS